MIQENKHINHTLLVPDARKVRSINGAASRPRYISKNMTFPQSSENRYCQRASQILTDGLWGATLSI